MFLRHCTRHALLIACSVPLFLACSESLSAGTNTASKEDAFTTEITHEDCDTESKSAAKIDANNDGRADITRVMEGTRESCRVLDLNFDGRVDNFLYFDDAGNLRRRESDFDRDGLIDEIGLYKNGKVVQKNRETNLDGKLDTWDTYANDKLTERKRDTNADGRIDQWWTFPDPTKLDCPVVATDEDGDGKPDARHDPCKEREAELSAAAQPWDKPAETAEDAGATEETPAKEDAGTATDEDGGS